MTISYPLTFPTHNKLIAITFRDHQVAAKTTAPWSGIQQVQEWPGSWWEADFTLPPMKRAVAEPWVAWLQSLRGIVGTFLLPTNSVAKGTASATPGTPQVDAGGQTGYTLAIKTGLTTQAGYLKAGDWISLGTGAERKLHSVVTDADLDANGKVTLDIWPRLRASPSVNDTVYVANTSGLFRRTENSNSYSISEGFWRIPIVTCREAV